MLPCVNTVSCETQMHTPEFYISRKDIWSIYNQESPNPLCSSVNKSQQWYGDGDVEENTRGPATNHNWCLWFLSNGANLCWVIVGPSWIMDVGCISVTNTNVCASCVCMLYRVLQFWHWYTLLAPSLILYSWLLQTAFKQVVSYSI